MRLSPRSSLLSETVWIAWGTISSVSCILSERVQDVQLPWWRMWGVDDGGRDVYVERILLVVKLKLSISLDVSRVTTRSGFILSPPWRVWPERPMRQGF